MKLHGNFPVDSEEVTVIAIKLIRKEKSLRKEADQGTNNISEKSSQYSIA